MTSVIGTAVPRSDVGPKLDGTAVYGADHREVGMAYAAVLRSPVPAGRIVRLDASAAREREDVIAVLTADDQPPIRGGWVVRDQTMLAAEVVRYEGEPVALVVAESRAVAYAALADIELVIDEWPGVDLERAGDPEARLIHPDWASYRPTGGVDFPRRGNLAAEMIADPDGVDDLFARAANVVEDEFRVARQYQAYMEPKAATARYDGRRFTIHTSVQYPFNVRDRVAQFLDVRPSDVRVVGHTIGGGFGGKLDASLEPLAALAARATGRTVHVRNDREEDMLTAPSRENAVIRIRTALDADGVMTARVVVCDADNGAYSGEMPWLASLPLAVVGTTYRVAGPVRVTSRLWYTNTTPTGAFRGVGGLYLYLAVERHMDHIAATLGVDRREYRLRHLLGDGSHTLTGQRLDDAGLLGEAFARLEEVAPWDETAAALGPNQGIGIAAGVWMTNPLPGNATVKINEDGVVQVITAANDNGSGSVTMGLVQVVAETMGVRPEQVLVSMPDTDVAGYDGGSQGSRTLHSAGRAAKDATTEARRQLLEVAAGMLEADAADLDIRDGRITVKGVPDSGVDVAQAATAAMFANGQITATASYATEPVPYDTACASGLLFGAMATPSYHAHLAVVEVDPVTGAVSVVRYVVVQETGRVINPVGVRGQVQGALAQAIGYTLYEGLRIGPDCRYVQRNLHEYRLPLGIHVPKVEFHPMEHLSEQGPFGALGVAEPPTVFAPAAIANAVSDAVGRRCNNLPISAADVLDALQENE